MKIGILQTGTVPGDLSERYVSYATMFERLLQKADPGFSVSLWDVNKQHEIPASPFDAEGWIITGSRHGVYEDHPWIEPLKTFLRDAHAARAPLVGVCFGHQILADALGGKVEKSDRGWGCGVHEYRVVETRPWMEGAKQTLSIIAMHQDQVITPPPGSTVLAQSEFCPYGLLAYGETAMSIQPHPEFDADFERRLLATRRGSVVPEAIADAALAGLDAPTDAAVFGRWMTRFFRHAASQREMA